MKTRLLLLFSILFGAFQASSQNAEARRPISLDDPSSRTAVVARVGSIGITAREFILNYEFAPSFIKQRKDAKKHLLNLMINEKLFALEGGQAGAAQQERIASALEEIEGDLATEELYKKDVLPGISVRSAELAGGIRESAVHMQVEWLYAPGPASRDSLEAALRRGEPFDTLFQRQNPDSADRTNRSLDASLFDIRKTNRPIGDVLSSLPPGTVSEAVRGPDGWYFTRIRDKWVSALQTQTEQMKIRHDVEESLKQQMADSLSDLYITAIMSRNRPVIVKETFGVLLAFLAQYYVDSTTASEWGFVPPAVSRHPWSMRDTRWVEDQALRPLVTLAGGRDTLSLATFLSWYRNRESLIKLSARAKGAFAFASEQLVWRMVRDRLLVEKARRRKLNTIEAVREQKKWWEEKLLFEAAKGSMRNDIPWRDEDLRAYYREHIRDFRGSAGDTVTFDRAKDDVLRSYFKLEMARRMFHRVVLLRRKYPVEVRDSVLARIPVDQNQAKPIDVYAVKKGGTFPRPAFPTVDPGWQEWY